LGYRNGGTDVPFSLRFMKSFRSTIITLSIFLVLLIVLFIFVPLKKRREYKKSAQLQILTLDPRDVSQIRIIRRKEPFTLTRLQDPDPKKAPLGYWEITEPKPLPVDKQEIKFLLGKLPSLRAKRLVHSVPENLAPFGLSRPRIRVIMEGDGYKEEIQIGKQSQVGKDFYAKMANNNKVFMIERSLRERLNRPLKTFRSREILNYEVPQIVYFEVQKPGTRWSAEKTNSPKPHPKSNWTIHLDKTQHKGLDQPIERLLRGIRRIQVDKFVADHITSKEIGQYRLIKPKYQIHFKDKDGHETGLLISGKVKVDKNTEHVYVMVKGGRFIYGVNSYFIENLSEPPNKYFHVDS